MRKIGQIFRFLIPVIALVALVVFMTGAGRRERATVEKNKAVVMRKLEAWNTGNMAIADEVYASDIVRHADTVPEGIIRGRDALKQYIMACRTAWPDFHGTALDVVAQGDKVVVRWKITGTFTGQVEGWPAPNGKETVFECLEMYRLAGGKIVEDWYYGQDTYVWYQMGLKLVPAK